jgi:glycosyltransferase involved in cell wall biosynthesis
MPDASSEYRPSVVLVSEYPPPAAGMPVQAQQLLLRLQQESYPITAIKTNPQFPAALRWIDRIRLVRGFAKWLVFLWQCLRIIRADIVHIFSASGLNYILFTIPPILIARVAGTRIIINYHGGAARDFFRRYPRLFKWSVKQSHSLVVPSGYLRDVFREFGEDSIIVPNLANVERFHFRERTQFRPLILSARNLTTVYNVACAIRVLQHVIKQYPQAELVIAGDGPEKERLMDMSRQAGLENKVHFLGNVKNENMPDVYQRCDIFINTSNVDNMPGSILEAWASGLPVVSTNVGGIPYMVDEGANGLLANANDDVALARHIVALLEQPQQAHAMTLRGREKLATLGWEQVSKGWRDEYARVYTRVQK